MNLERNKSTVRRYIEEVINEGKVELIDELFVPDLAAYVKESMSKRSAFPDGREEILALVGEGNTVMAMHHFTALQQIGATVRIEAG